MSAKEITRLLLWIFVYAICGYFFLLFAGPYFGKGSVEERKTTEIGWLYVHLSFGFFALFLAPLQFIPAIRKRYPRFHRTTGKIYVTGATLASLMAFYLLSKYPLPASIPSLALLAFIWLFTTIIAYLFARRKNFLLHRQFMIRSYMCALAFVYLRLFDMTDGATGLLSFIKNAEARSTVIDWSWIFPLMITEFFLNWYPALKKLNPNK